MTVEERAFIAALDADPDDNTTRAAYADWLDEQGRPYEAILQRGEAGISEVLFKLRRKSDGLFAEAHWSKPKAWTRQGKMWRRLSDLRAHLTAHARSYPKYFSISYDALEVVVIELRTDGIVLPVRRVPGTSGIGRRVTIAVPTGGAEGGAK